MKDKKFWNWINDETTGERTLRLDGVISEESWWDDDVTPKKFREELNSGDGDISVYINSPGGDVFAASQIYTMLKEYKGKVTVKIDGLAASAASVVAMAGDVTAMSPTSIMMIHNPWTIALGDEEEMKAVAEFLAEVKETILNAYELKTHLSREKVSEMMTDETWLNAKKALEMGFCDKILFTENEGEGDSDTTAAMLFSPRIVQNSVLKKIADKKCAAMLKSMRRDTEEKEKNVDAGQLYKRLNLLKH